MARRVYGFFLDAVGGDAQWVTAEGENLQSTKVRARDEIILFVPGDEVTVVFAPVPVRSGAQAREAAAYSVEEEIAVSVEDEHVALGAPGADLTVPRAVHVVAKQKMIAWRDALNGQSVLANAKLVSAPSVLSDGVVLEVEGTYLAHIDGRAFGIGADMPERIAETLFANREVNSLSVQEALATLARFAEGAGELVDLRQGDFQARASARLQDFRAWRTSALLAVAVLLAWVGSSLLQIQALNQETAALEARVAQTYRAAFPDAPARTNYVRAVATALDERGEGQIDFRDASAALYSALQSLPNAELRAIRFDEVSSGFVARIAYSAYGEDAELKAALAEEGFVATLGALRQEGTKVVGDVAFGGGT